MIFRRVVLLMRLCPMPTGPFRVLRDRGGNLLSGDLLSGGHRVTYFYPLSPNNETY